MADGFFTCGVMPIGTGPVVFSQVDTMNRRVDQTLTTTLNLADSLASYQVANINFTVDPTPVQSYTIKTVDDATDFDAVEFDEFGPIPTIDAAFVTTPALPDGEPLPPGDAPPVDIPTPPTAYHPAFGLTPTIVFPAVPSYGDLTSGVPFPDLLPITLPPAPDVDFGIPFTATPPVFDARPPDAADFNYTEQAYDPLLVSEIKTAIQATLAGTTGLPRVVEEALWQREAEREAATAASAVRDAFDEMAARGFTLPNGPLQSKLLQVKQNSQNQKNSLGRDVMIRVHEVLVDQFKFGVAQGIALENTWIQLYSDIQNRRLQAARVAVDIAIQVYNALVAQYQAAAAVYKTQADVFATRIQAELAKLQAYSEQLRAQQLIGELNQQAVAIYTARLNAIEINVRAYLADIEAYGQKINGEKLKLDAFRTTIEIEDEKLKANQAEFQIWSGQLQGQQLIQQSFATRAQTYLGNVQAWRTKYEAQIDRQRGEIAALEAQTSRYVARIQGLTAQGNYQVARGQAIIAGNTAKVQRLQADVAMASSYNTALSEKIRMINAANAQNTELALKNGEINAQNGLAVAQLLEHAIATATQVLAQMTSSFASSVNMHANVSDATQFSQSCNYSTSQSFS
jgi:hypothetical protein